MQSHSCERLKSGSVIGRMARAMIELLRYTVSWLKWFLNDGDP